MMVQRSLHGLQMLEETGDTATAVILHERTSYHELSKITEQGKRRAEVVRL